MPFPFRADNSPVAKLLTILVLGILVYLIVSRVRRGADRAVPPPRAPSDRSASGLPEDMVQCAVCDNRQHRSPHLGLVTLDQTRTVRMKTFALTIFF